MEDKEIIQLYWQRNQQAIEESNRKYGRYCYSIAYNLLNDHEDSEECVSDTFLGAWNAMPPHKPSRLQLFLAKITRSLAFNRYQSRTAQKRGGGELPLVLEELSECIGGGTDPEEKVEAAELSTAIEKFVKTLSVREHSIFVDRYFYTESIEKVAEKNSLTLNNTYVILSRIRGKLRAYLAEEGFCDG